MENYNTVRSTVGGLQLSDVRRWISFWSLIYSVVTHQPIIFNKCSRLHDFRRCVCSEWISTGKHQTDVFGLKCIPALFLSYQCGRYSGHLCGLWCSSWSILGSFLSVLVILGLHRNVSFSSGCSSALVKDGWRRFYMLNNTFFVIQ